MIVALVLVVSVACTAGGRGTVEAGSTTSVFTPTSMSTIVTTTTLDPTKAAILTAYRAEWADYTAIAEAYPVNPFNPRLPMHATGKELSAARDALAQLNVHDHYNVGLTDLAPIVTSISGNSAVIMDCIFDHSYEVDAQTRKPVEQPDVGHGLYTFKMTRLGEAWYVSDSTMLISGKTEDGCSPGDA